MKLIEDAQHAFDHHVGDGVGLWQLAIEDGDPAPGAFMIEDMSHILAAAQSRGIQEQQISPSALGGFEFA
ncbi:MAG TPA: hypothetical protein VGO35_05510 [Gammaproteobacteria bacterium]|nr:hypothetical protein [Gammaproteobacteria bacterium]